MTPLVSTAPSDILKAACKFGCSQKGQQMDLRTYLLEQAEIQASPPCITPASPVITSVVPFTSNLGIGLSVTWKQPHNTGSLIKSYLVQFGTTNGGPYPQFAIRTAKNAFIGPLTPGTTYYIIVTAQSFTGCSSAPSAQASGTTSGGPPGNGLLNGLLGYWKLNDTTTGNGFVWTDSTGNGFGATQRGNFVQSDAITFKIEGGSAKDLSAGSGSGMSISAAIDTRAVTTPFTVAMWILDAGNAFANNLLANDDVANRNWSLYMSDAAGGAGGGNFVSLQTWLTTSGVYSGAITAPFACQTNLAFDYIIAGFDGVNRFISINNSALVTSAVASVGRGTSALTQMFRGDFLATWLGHLNGLGYWNRALSASDRATLWNGGAGLAFASFTH